MKSLLLDDPKETRKAEKKFFVSCSNLFYLKTTFNIFEYLYSLHVTQIDN